MSAASYSRSSFREDRASHTSISARSSVAKVLA